MQRLLKLLHFLKGLLLVIEFRFHAQNAAFLRKHFFENFLWLAQLAFFEGHHTLMQGSSFSFRIETNYGRTLSERECCSVAIACHVALSQENAAPVAHIRQILIVSAAHVLRSQSNTPLLLYISWMEFNGIIHGSYIVLLHMTYSMYSGINLELLQILTGS